MCTMYIRQVAGHEQNWCHLPHQDKWHTHETLIAKKCWSWVPRGITIWSMHKAGSGVQCMLPWKLLKSEPLFPTISCYFNSLSDTSLSSLLLGIVVLILDLYNVGTMVTGPNYTRHMWHSSCITYMYSMQLLNCWFHLFFSFSFFWFLFISFSVWAFMVWTLYCLWCPWQCYCQQCSWRSLAGCKQCSVLLLQVYVRIRDEEWNVYRRYTEFHNLHKKVKKRFPVATTYDFPPKKAIGNKVSYTLECEVLCWRSWSFDCCLLHFGVFFAAVHDRNFKHCRLHRLWKRGERDLKPTCVNSSTWCLRSTLTLQRMHVRKLWCIYYLFLGEWIYIVGLLSSSSVITLQSVKTSWIAYI